MHYFQFFQFLVPTMPEGWLTKLSKELNSPFNYTFKDRLRLVGGPQRSSAYISGKITLIIQIYDVLFYYLLDGI